MITVIMSVRQEADIIETTLRHYIGQGVDRIVISDGGSRDGTVATIERVRKEYPAQITRVRPLPSPPFYQEREMSVLVVRAIEMGSDWIIPSDADEFVFAIGGGLISEALARVPPNSLKLSMQVWRHHSWELCEMAPEYNVKVAFRGIPGTSLIVGQHDCSIPGEGCEGVLGVRELKYRSFDHFCSKIAAQLKTMRPEWGPQFATHVQKFRDASVDTMQEAWTQMAAVSTKHDPIPSTLNGLI